MKKRSMLAIAMTLLLLVSLLTGCGSSAKSEAAMDQAWEAPAEMPAEAPMTPYPETEEIAVENFSTTSAYEDTAMNVEQVQTYAEKIIYSGSVHLETTAFDDAASMLERAVREYGGFVQDSNVNGSTRYNEDGTTNIVDRWGYYTVRIPAARFDAFMTMAGKIGNVTNSSRTAENVTSQYTDYEARLTSLNTQEERLLVMLEKTGDLDSLIELEKRLSEVRYEIESIERNLRNLDQRLAYSTVTLELREVELYTPTKSVQRTFGEKLSDAFRDGWQGFARGFQNFTVSLVFMMPTLLLLLVLAVAVIVVVCKVRKKRRTKNQAAKPEEPKE